MSVKEVKSGQQYRYYRLRKRILSGVPSKKIERRLKIVELYGCESREELIQNNRNLRASMNRRGIKYEDCYSASVSRQKGLYSLKGFCRLDGRISGDIFKLALEKCWRADKKEHKVEMIAWMSNDDVRCYMRERMLVGVGEGEYANKHLAASKGWLLAEGEHVSGYGWFRQVRSPEVREWHRKYLEEQRKIREWERERKLKEKPFKVRILDD